MRYITLLTLLILCSCNATENNDATTVSINKFPVDAELIAEVISIPPIAMTPFNIFTNEDKLVMYNAKKDTLFDIFSLPECKFLFSAGYKGQGPNDFFDLDRRLFIPTAKGFKTFFQSHKELRDIRICDKSIEIIKENTLKFDLDQYPVNGFTPLTDSTCIYWSGFGEETEYDLFNRNTKEIVSFSPYPQWTKAEKEDKLFTYAKNITVKPDGKRFAAFYGYFKKLRIYDANGALIKEVSLDIDPCCSDLDLDVSERTIYYYSYSKSSDEYIYALCRNDKSSVLANPELQIWKWDGTPVGRYKLDRYISLFTISEKYGKMYAVNGEKEDEIYVFQLPNKRR